MPTKKNEAEGLLESIKDILNQPLPGTKKKSKKSQVETPSRRSRSILDVLTEALNTPLPGTKTNQKQKKHEKVDTGRKGPRKQNVPKHRGRGRGEEIRSIRDARLKHRDEFAAFRKARMALRDEHRREREALREEHQRERQELKQAFEDLKHKHKKEIKQYKRQKA